MPLDLKFLIAGLVLTVILGFILVPIIMKAINEDNEQGGRK